MTKQVERPLSPHLQIYRWQITMMMSIMHRATGIALSGAMLVFMWWLVALAAGPAAYEQFVMCVTHPVGLVILFGISVALFFHTCTGVRHIVLDTGRWFKIPEIYKSGYATLAAAVLLSAAFWAAVLA